jgi:hypothetical protein
MSKGLKFPAAPNTDDLVVVATADVQAATAKAPNSQLPVIIVFLLTPYKAQWAI